MLVRKCDVSARVGIAGSASRPTAASHRFDDLKGFIGEYLAGEACGQKSWEKEKNGFTLQLLTLCKCASAAPSCVCVSVAVDLVFWGYRSSQALSSFFTNVSLCACVCLGRFLVAAGFYSSFEDLKLLVSSLVNLLNGVCVCVSLLVLSSFPGCTRVLRLCVQARRTRQMRARVRVG